MEIFFFHNIIDSHYMRIAVYPPVAVFRCSDETFCTKAITIFLIRDCLRFQFSFLFTFLHSRRRGHVKRKRNYKVLSISLLCMCVCVWSTTILVMIEYEYFYPDRHTRPSGVWTRTHFFFVLPLGTHSIHVFEN